MLPLLGIKISYLQAFIDNHGGKARFLGKTSYEVVEEYIKPLTSMHRCSYCELLQLHGSSMVGKANVFISYAWGDLFLDIVAKLENPANFYFLDSYLIDHFEKTIIWMDIFSYNQYQTSNKDFTWWSTTFQAAIKEIHFTLFIVSRRSVARGWCIWEIYCTIQSKSRFHICILVTNPKEFCKAVIYMKSVNSQCSKGEDRVKIHQAIRQAGGFRMIDQMIWSTMGKRFFTFSFQIGYQTLISAYLVYMRYITAFQLYWPRIITLVVMITLVGFFPNHPLWLVVYSTRRIKFSNPFWKEDNLPQLFQSLWILADWLFNFLLYNDLLINIFWFGVFSSRNTISGLDIFIYLLIICFYCVQFPLFPVWLFGNLFPSKEYAPFWLRLFQIVKSLFHCVWQCFHITIFLLLVKEYLLRGRMISFSLGAYFLLSATNHPLQNLFSHIETVAIQYHVLPEVFQSGSLLYSILFLIGVYQFIRDQRYPLLFVVGLLIMIAAFLSSPHNLIWRSMDFIANIFD